MKRKVKQESVEAQQESTPVDAGDLVMLPISDIVESQTNPRKTFTGLEELAESIKATGLHQPIVVRPGNPGSLICELVFGARRLRACRIIGLETVPVIRRYMTDAQVREAQLIENNQRQDVNPMEEADAYDQVIRMDGYNIAKLAAKIGRSESYVAQRIQLLKLHKDFQTMLLQEKITLAHGKLLARSAIASQEKLANEWEWKDWKDDDWECPSVHELANDLNHERRELKSAPFDAKNAQLYPIAGACTECQNRTGFNRMLFADLDTKNDQCNDPVCFQAKVEAHIQREAEKLEAKGIKFEKAWDGGYVPEEGKSKGAKPLGYGVNEITAKDAKSLSPADIKTVLLVGGNRAGKVVMISAAKHKSPEKTRIDASVQKKKIAKAATTVIKQKIVGICDNNPLGLDGLRFIVGRMWVRATNDTCNAVAKSIGLEKSKTEYGFAKPAMAYIAKASQDQLSELLLLLATESLFASDYDGNLEESTKAAADQFGIDWKKIVKEETAKLKANKKGKKKDAEKAGQVAAVDDEDEREEDQDDE
jgi:ParB family transcriptional regulator, chromosome partitioning protein